MGEIEIRRIADGGQHVPRRGDRQHDQDAPEGMQTAPRLAQPQLPRDGQIQQHRATGNTAAISPFSSSPVPIAAAIVAAHSAGLGSSRIERPQKADHIASAMVVASADSGI